MAEDREVEAWLNRRDLVLDLARLTDTERVEGSIFLGGNGATFVRPSGDIDYGRIGTVVFRWGDPKAIDIFAVLLEHADRPAPTLFEFAATTIIGNEVWMLSVQDREFDPATVYRSPRHYVVLPFEAELGQAALQEFLSRPTPRPELIGHVGMRWVAFEVGISLRPE